MPSEAELVRIFLGGRDAPCPACGYNLRDAAGDSCPECGTRVQLTIAAPAPRPPVRIATAVLVIFGLMYLYHAVVWIWMLQQSTTAPLPWAWWEVSRSVVGVLLTSALLLWFAFPRPGRREREAVFVRLTLWCILLMTAFSVLFGLGAGFLR